ncbi:hypothetical protein VTI28DRAFT_8787 [Corynascus sepedonium]
MGKRPDSQLNRMEKRNRQRCMTKAQNPNLDSRYTLVLPASEPLGHRSAIRSVYQHHRRYQFKICPL